MDLKLFLQGFSLPYFLIFLFQYIFLKPWILANLCKKKQMGLAKDYKTSLFILGLLSSMVSGHYSSVLNKRRATFTNLKNFFTRLRFYLGAFQAF